ncbi:hypothetical protein D0Z00_000462 [Geotrichum galactomycetum]|uniref:Uncharacterized protein n=1 Tax=Geotrichum galactomycetum TaxID=27317 RepID=A0ACB6V9U1_9ASCO|nr:hypothetical protein D0Z00_000462 [Geotrichum candidum]
MDLLSKILFIPEKPAKTIPVKALTYVSKDTPPVFIYTEFNSPIKKSDVLIKVHAAALNPIDLQLMHSPLSVTAPGKKGLGRDFCGIIEEVGANQQGKWAVGDRVCGMFIHLAGQGTISTHVTLNPDTDRIIKAPPNLTDEEAAAFPLSFGTAIRSLRYTKLDPNSWVLILGGNTATGHYAIQLAKNYFNVAKVVVTASSENEFFLRKLGADIIVDYKKNPDLVEALKYVIADNQDPINGDFTYGTSGPDTNQQKFQIIFDCVGGTEVLFKATELLNPKATGSVFVTIVGDSTTTPNQLGGTGAYLYHPSMIGRRILSSTGINGLNYVVESVTPGDWLNESYEIMLNQTVRVIIDSVYEWDKWKQAYAKLESRKLRGKIVLHVSD